MTTNLPYPRRVDAFMRGDCDLGKAETAAHLDALVRYEGQIPNFIDGISATFCLKAACAHARPEIAAHLIDNCGADTGHIIVARPEGKPVIQNLLHDALLSYIYTKEADHSPEGWQRLTDTVELLLRRGVDAAPNEDPSHNPVRYAAIIARPLEAANPDSPEYDWSYAALVGAGKIKPLPPLAAPYGLFRAHAPEQVEAYEKPIVQACLAATARHMMSPAFKASARQEQPAKPRKRSSPAPAGKRHP